MNRPVRWILSVGLIAIMFGVPIVYFRAEYAHHKRLRVVKSDVLYRSGQMTAAGFRDAVARFGIRTIINCQNEFPDPDLPLTFWLRQTVRESELCRDLGVRYIHLDPDLVPNRCDPGARPEVIDQFLSIIDDISAHPILLHCKAGLHRTGILVAAYRQEYDRWGPYAALEELKANGFGDSAATAANDYIQQYVLNYRPRPARVSGPGYRVSGKSLDFPTTSRISDPDTRHPNPETRSPKPDPRNSIPDPH